MTFLLPQPERTHATSACHRLTQPITATLISLTRSATVRLWYCNQQRSLIVTIYRGQALVLSSSQPYLLAFIRMAATHCQRRRPDVSRRVVGVLTRRVVPAFR